MLHEKKFSFFTLIVFSAAILTSSCGNSNASTNSKIEGALNKCHKKYDIPAMQVSVSLPGDYSTRDFVVGTTEANGKTKVTTENLFQIGSITKSFTAALILQLEEDGKLNIDDPLSKHLEFSDFSSWPVSWKEITIKQVLNMTSGIFNFSEDKGYVQTLLAQPNKVWTLTDLIGIAAKKPLYFPPGKGWHYSNTGYALAGMIIEKIAGKTFEEVINERILGPVNLINTFYSGGNYSKEIMSRAVHGYAGDQYIPSPNTSWSGPSGGILSNSRDVIKWVRALFSGHVIKPKQLDEMKTLVCTSKQVNECTPGQDVSPKMGGFGLALGEKYVHPFGEVWLYKGSTLGFLCFYLFLPSYDTVITIAGDKTLETDEYLYDLSFDILNILHSSLQWQSYRKTHQLGEDVKPLDRKMVFKQFGWTN